MRNGLAIAGMAGGLFFLGQAVASASDQGAAASSGVTQTNSSSTDEGSGSNQNSSESTATNVKKVEVDSTVTGGYGGTNNASINTGVIPGGPISGGASTLSKPKGDEEHGDDHSTKVDVTTGDVSLTQNANGGSVNGSGNIAVGDTGGSQTATATNTVNQSNTSTGDEGKGKGKDKDGSVKASESDNSNSNSNESSSEAKNIHKVEVDSTVSGGDGGTNNAEINTGIIGNTFYCPKHSTCTFNFTTGNVTVWQNANGGDVNGSGNIGIGAPVPVSCTCPEKAASPAVKAASAPSSSAAKVSSAQPTGQLAFTGSDVSLPLTVGLLTLVAGLGLTVLGRRRETQAI